MATLEKLEKNKVKITVEVSAEAFDEAIQKAYQKTKGRYSVPGFRKGKAPKKMIENMYGESVFYEDAFDMVYADSYQKTVEELALDPVERPDISLEKISADEGVVYTAEFAVRPEVSLGAYKGIEVVKRAYTVEDTEVDRILAQEQEKLARFVDQDRPVQNGDRVLLDYSGSVGGVKFDGGTAEDATLDVGSGTFIPGFEEQLVGMQKDEEKAIDVKFPEEYHAEELKGAEAVFEVKIKAVQEKELPELDDELAQDISEFDTLEEWRKDKREALQKRNEERAKGEMEDEAVVKAMENASFDVPDAMIERQMDYMLQDMAYRLQMSGLNLEDYCKYTGTDVREMREGYREEAERRVRTSLVIEAIGKAENIEATEEDLHKELAEYAEQAGKTAEEYKKTLSEDDLAYFNDRIVAQKTIDLIMEHAKLVAEPKKKAAKPKAEAGEEKPKKAAAKPKPEKAAEAPAEAAEPQE